MSEEQRSTDALEHMKQLGAAVNFLDVLAKMECPTLKESTEAITTLLQEARDVYALSLATDMALGEIDFDPNMAANAAYEKAVALLRAWARDGDT